jgi:hypothetical protein
MTLEKAMEDPDVRSCVTELFKHRGFSKLRIAFVSHSPKGDDKSENSVSVAYGENLGTRYVFNKIEELALKPQTQTQTTPRRMGGQDPDLDTSRR